ncbi:MAG: N-acetyltransferase family protein [Oscillospiraceae bacterium]|nr:N-acetyltransferase family protein [Oscillospiraceae bacterium]
MAKPCFDPRADGAFTIRLAAPADAAGILAVYAPYITGTCITFETEVPSAKAFAERTAAILREYPYYICRIDNKIVGFAYASQHRERAAYRYSADVSVYVEPAHQRQGIGKALYTVLLEAMTEQGIYTAYAGITLPNEKSIGLHKSFGFHDVGVYSHVGYKSGKWLDVLWMEKALREYGKP